MAQLVGVYAWNCSAQVLAKVNVKVITVLVKRTGRQGR